MIPNYQEFFNPVLNCYKQVEPQRAIDVVNMIDNYFHFTAEDKLETTAGGALKIKDRTQWSIYYLFRAGLLQRQARGQYQLSNFGKQWLNKFSNEKINNNVLTILSNDFQSYLYSNVLYQTLTLDDLYPSLLESIRSNIKNYLLNPETKDSIEAQSINVVDQEDPDSEIGESYEKYKKNIIERLQDEFSPNDDPLSTTSKGKPFEDFVVHVLGKCGYGIEEYNKSTQLSRDKGIDGVLFEDFLGLSKIGVQVKHYSRNNKVGSKDIQAFIGALLQSGFNKGIFVTSSSFTSDAIDASYKTAHCTIILIDGYKLASILFDQNIGITITKEMKMVQINEDLFSQLRLK